MDRISYPAILVVEGATDVAFLSSFLDAEFVTTNGSDVPRETIEYLKEAVKRKTVVVLTDPDYPGRRIRGILDENVPGLMHAFVRKEHSIKKHKVGVAESTKEEVMLALSHVVPSKTGEEGNLTMADLMEFGLMRGVESKALRERIEERLHLGHGNAKTLLRRMNALCIGKEDIEEAMRDDR